MCHSRRRLNSAPHAYADMPPSRIIFAHPCKTRTDIEYAAEHHIEYTTFDTDSELDKIARFNPRFRCVLRIRADDPDARVPLGLKYGASLEDVPSLLQHAQNLGLQVQKKASLGSDNDRTGW